MKSEYATALEVIEEYHDQIRREVGDFWRDWVDDPFLQEPFPIADPSGQYGELWWSAIQKEVVTQSSESQRLWTTNWRAAFSSEGIERFAVWFIGLPGSGKSTLAIALFFFLLRHLRPISWIDGDMRPYRPFKQDTLRFTEEIAVWRSLNRRLDYIMRKLGGSLRYKFVVGSSFCPSTIQRLALEAALHRHLLLVYVNTPRVVCEQRRKVEGYFTDHYRNPGVDQFLVPDKNTLVPADLTIDTCAEPLHRSIERIVLRLEEKGWVIPGGGVF